MLLHKYCVVYIAITSSCSWLVIKFLIYIRKMFFIVTFNSRQKFIVSNVEFVVFGTFAHGCVKFLTRINAEISFY